MEFFRNFYSEHLLAGMFPLPAAVKAPNTRSAAPNTVPTNDDQQYRVESATWKQAIALHPEWLSQEATACWMRWVCVWRASVSPWVVA